MADKVTVWESDPKFDKRRKQWYWEGKQNGKKVRKYDKGGQDTYDDKTPRSSHETSTAGVEADMANVSIADDSYGSGVAYSLGSGASQATGQYGTIQDDHQGQPEQTSSDYQAQVLDAPQYEQYYGASPNQQYEDSTSSRTYDHQPQTSRHKGKAPVSSHDYYLQGNADQFGTTTDTYGSSYNTHSSHHQQASAPSTENRRDQKQRHGRTAKGKGPAADLGYIEGQEEQYLSPGTVAQSSYVNDDPAYSQSGGQPTGYDGKQSRSRPRHHSQSSGGSVSGSKKVQFLPAVADQDEDEGDDPALQQSIRESRKLYDSAFPSTAGEPSHAIYGHQYPVYEEAELEGDEGDGDETIKQQHQKFLFSEKTHISGTTGDVERLDPRYKLEHSFKFVPGTVFKILWYEPRGHPVGGGSILTENATLRDHMNNVHVGFRRFIVIANDEGHCQCVPILTYGTLACGKKGVKPKKHGIVYEYGEKPKTVSKEPELGFKPICMKITAKNEHIQKQSRVNYSKIITVEHNVKVFFIGRIVLADWDIVVDAVDKCWGDKILVSSHPKDRRSKK